MKTIRLTLKHDGTNWVATDGELYFAGRSLDELDEEVRRYVKTEEDFRDATEVKVYMYYDNWTIPQWIRQYAQHYFDRILEIRL